MSKGSTPNALGVLPKMQLGYYPKHNWGTTPKRFGVVPRTGRLSSFPHVTGRTRTQNRAGTTIRLIGVLMENEQAPVKKRLVIKRKPVAKKEVKILYSLK